PSPEKPAVPLPAKKSTKSVEFTNSRTIWLLVSPTKMLLDESSKTPQGLLSTTPEGAMPLNNVGTVGLPLPATVLILPPTVNSRTRSLLRSAIRNFVAPVTAATPWGLKSSALVAEPPSPEKPAVPLPATVLMSPPTVNWRIFWQFWSG